MGAILFAFGISDDDILPTRAIAAANVAVK